MQTNYPSASPKDCSSEELTLVTNQNETVQFKENLFIGNI